MVLDSEGEPFCVLRFPSHHRKERFQYLVVAYSAWPCSSDVLVFGQNTATVLSGDVFGPDIHERPAHFLVSLSLDLPHNTVLTPDRATDSGSGDIIY